MADSISGFETTGQGYGYEDEIDDSYAVSTGEISTFLDGNEPILAGPRYHMKSSQGADIYIQIAYKKRDQSDLTIVLCTATDQTGTLLGHRKTFLDERDEEFVGTGDVNVIKTKRNAGVLVPIELANIDFLRRFATEQSKTIFYQVINGNRNYQIQLRKDLNTLVASSEKPESVERKIFLEQELQQAQAEEVRWNAVWGPHGKLGFGENGVKEFNGNTNMLEGNEHLTDIDTIELERTDSGNVVEGNVTKVELIQGDKNTRNARVIDGLKKLSKH